MIAYYLMSNTIERMETNIDIERHFSLNYTTTLSTQKICRQYFEFPTHKHADGKYSIIH